MGKFVIKEDKEKVSSINRTIRMKPDSYEKIMELSEKHNISFNKVLNQCVEFALNNLED